MRGFSKKWVAGIVGGVMVAAFAYVTVAILIHAQLSDASSGLATMTAPNDDLRLFPNPHSGSNVHNPGGPPAMTVPDADAK